MKTILKNELGTGHSRLLSKNDGHSTFLSSHQIMQIPCQNTHTNCLTVFLPKHLIVSTSDSDHSVYNMYLQTM